MKFENALKAMKEGKKVSRIPPNGEYVYLSHSNGVKSIFCNTSKTPITLCTEAILADDWEIVEEIKNKTEIILYAKIVEILPGIRVLNILKPLPVNDTTLEIRALLGR